MVLNLQLKTEVKWMEYYTGLLVFIFIIYIVTSQMQDIDRARKLFFVVSCAAVILFQGFRSFNVGTDLASYIPAYSKIGVARMGNLEYLNYESGYVVFNKILYIVGLDERGFLVAVAAAVQIPIYYTMYRYSEMSLISILWYFAFGNFLMTFSGLRQSIAMSLCFIAYYFIKERKLFFYIALILFAALFHSSALFCLILYPLYYMKLDKRKIFVVFGLLGLVFLFRNQIFSFLSALYYGEAKSTTTTGAYTMFIAYMLLLVVSFFRSEEEYEDYIGLRNVLLVLTMIYSFAPLHDYVTRIGYPLSLYMTIFIPKLINNFDVVPRVLYHLGCYVVLIVAFFYFLGGLNTLPFSFG